MKAIFLHMIDGLVEFSVHDKRARSTAILSPYIPISSHSISLFFQIIFLQTFSTILLLPSPTYAQTQADYSVRLDSVAVSYTESSIVFDVPVLITATDSAAQIGGYDILLSFDSKKVNLLSIRKGELFDSCKWKYFSYRIYAADSCDGCGDSLIRVVGLKELGYLTPPQCTNPTPEPMSIAILTFTTARYDCLDDPNPAQLRFQWRDCGDNTISYVDGSGLFTNNEVIDSRTYSSSLDDSIITQLNASFPGIHGAPDGCLADSLLHGKFMKREVDYFNGELPTYFSDCPDYPGDLNLNGIPFELADLQLFADFIEQGKSVLPSGIGGRGLRILGDLNDDGYPFTIADLIMMWNIVYGHQLRTDSLQPNVLENREK